MDSIIMGNNYNFNDWFKIGSETGMFDFSSPILRNYDLAYQEAVNFIDNLKTTPDITVEDVAERSMSDDRYFMTLPEDPEIRVERMWLGQNPGYQYRLPQGLFCTVIKYGDTYKVSPQFDPNTRKFKSRQEAGIFILKWILSH